MTLKPINQPSLWGIKIDTPSTSKSKYFSKNYSENKKIITYTLPNGTEICLSFTSTNRKDAIFDLAFSIYTVPLRTVISIITSLFNIFSFGQASILTGYEKNSLKGRVKAMSHSLLSLVTTPLNMVLDITGKVSNIIKPKD